MFGVSVPLSECQKYHQMSRPLNLLRRLCILIAVLTLSGCAGFVSVEQKFGDKPLSRDIHIVKKSETLFSLAWRYGWDYKALASANSIPAPYTIFPGQKLNITHRDNYKAPTSKPNSKSLTKPKTRTSAKGPSAFKTRSKPPVVESSSHGLTWQWPSKGKVIAKFSSKRPVNKGIDITGRIGESVMAAAAGSVVYSGSGLLGYGNLVIIKHNEQYLSAYAHNKRLLVKEGQKVKAGQVIAEIGSSGTDKVKLHFEIRRQGKPVNPIKYLPKVK
jgi:lipoprotein NlpD